MKSKLYTRLVLEVKNRMESGEPDLECFSARLWEQQAQLDLDLVTISYGKPCRVRNSSH